MGTDIPQYARLVRITHDRCSEYDGTEYVLAPGHWSEERVDEIIHFVREEMIRDAKIVKESPLAPRYQPPYAEHPGLTVAEVQKLHEEQKVAFKQWKEENDHLTRSLQARLAERGFIQLHEAGEKEGTIKASIYWGHNHGLHLNYAHAEY